MCRERWRTRDRLLEYDPRIMIPRPHTAGLPMIYPWENQQLTILMHQLYEIAKNSGFNDSEDQFSENFGAYLSNKSVIYANYIDFPETGELEKLYFDLQEKILYYWDGDYIPVNAMLIANTILNGGEA